MGVKYYKGYIILGKKLFTITIFVTVIYWENYARLGNGTYYI